MYYLRTEQSFDSAHFLKDYVGKCRNIHGHRWRVVVELAAEGLEEEGQERGMLVDFGKLRPALKGICKEFDHSLIFEKGALMEQTYQALQAEGFRLREVEFRPTAENFAHYFYERMGGLGYPVHRVEVYETPNNSASYEDGSPVRAQGGMSE